MKYQIPDLYVLETRIKEIKDLNEFLLIQLDDTIFYPGGGGQPCDTGTILSSSAEGEVIEVLKDKGIITHKVKLISGVFQKGDKVALTVNKERRDQLVRMHTGEHILFKALERQIKDVSLDKIDLSEEESRLFVKTKELDWSTIFKAETLANKIIEDSLEIKEHLVKKQDVNKYPKLRINIDRIKDDTIRVIEVDSFDWSACAGVHARNTSFVKALLVTNLLCAGKDTFEIRFKVNCRDTFFELARSARLCANILKTDALTAPDRIKTLQEKNEELKKKIYSFYEKDLDNMESDVINGITFFSKTTEGLGKKQIVDKGNALIETNDTIAVILNNEENTTIFIFVSKNLVAKGSQAKDFLKVIAQFGGKGGGRDGFASGSLDSGHASEVVGDIKNRLQQL